MGLKLTTYSYVVLLVAGAASQHGASADAQVTFLAEWKFPEVLNFRPCEGRCRVEMEVPFPSSFAYGLREDPRGSQEWLLSLYYDNPLDFASLAYTANTGDCIRIAENEIIPFLGQLYVVRSFTETGRAKLCKVTSLVPDGLVPKTDSVLCCTSSRKMEIAEEGPIPYRRGKHFSCFTMHITDFTDEGAVAKLTPGWSLSAPPKFRDQPVEFHQLAAGDMWRVRDRVYHVRAVVAPVKLKAGTLPGWVELSPNPEPAGTPFTDTRLVDYLDTEADERHQSDHSRIYLVCGVVFAIFLLLLIATRKVSIPS